MKEQFDKKLADKIKASFDNHQEAHDPKEWDKLASVYFAKPKGAAFPSWAYWAASIAAIAILATSLLYNSTEENTVFTSKNEIEKREDTLLIEKEKNLDLAPETITSKDKNLALEEENKETSTQIQSEKTQSRQTVTKTLTQTKSSIESQIPEEDKLVAEITKAKIKEDIGKEENLVASVIEDELNENEVNEIEKINSMAGKPMDSALKKEEENKALATINQWLSDGSEKDKQKKQQPPMEPLKLGVYLTPQSTTSSTQAVNLGAGVITELPVSKKFKIDVGLAYAQQNLVPGTNNNSRVMVAESLAYSDRSAMMSSNFITTTNELSFGQLEIPFNLKYKVFENQKSDIYVISGVSNMFYLNQRNTVTYNTVNLASSGFVGSQAGITTISETFTPESQNNSSNTGIGQLLNLSVGFEQNLTNGTFLSVEPFYKLSLGNQTFINQQFSIGGLNLRMNFQLKDKK